ncbi:MAG: hypothetical protein ACAI44_16015 [Candidatus Sericytochromatia bacterium]
MCKKSPGHLAFTWFIMLGMLFHVLVGHQHDWHELLANEVVGQISLESADYHEHFHRQHPGEPAQPESSGHRHITMDHSDAYTCQSSTQAQDLLAHRLASLLADLPRLNVPPEPPLQLAASFGFTEPQPPPEQRRRVLTSTILLI